MIRQGGQTKLSATGGNPGLDDHAAPVQAVPGDCQLVGQLVSLSAPENESATGATPVAPAHNRALQRNLQHFIHGFHEVHFQAGENLLGDIRKVFSIILRKHEWYASPFGGRPSTLSLL